MKDSVSALTREFLSWVDLRPRTYAETMEAWRTSCPRLSIWENASIEGLVAVESAGGPDAPVTLTELGRAKMVSR